ncbi:hypothetical protein [Falsiroseomonas sp. E2-1-a20]|uniref:hypothetical protein n=1 Tax=Falsiroseomonas sp. E2-1-a20 TaxID=3239300 RepID=UPI003F3F3B32
MIYSRHLPVDEAFYILRNPDIADSGMTAQEHYTTYGHSEGRAPNALYDAQWYLETNPDVVAFGIDPLEHFLTYGWQEGRDPSPHFDTAYYLASNPDVAEAGLNPLEHYLSFGEQEGRNPSEAFDTAFYLAENPDVGTSGMNPLTHYLIYGEAEGRRPLPPTFAATVDADGMVVFSGTARGDLVLALDGTTARFTREGVEATVTDFDEVEALALDGLILAAEAPALSGIVVQNGVLVLGGITPGTDLSRIDAAVDVTVLVSEEVDLSGNPDLGTIDAYEVDEGVILTLSVAQAEASTVNGTYAIRDALANLLDEAEVRPVVAGAQGGVTLTDGPAVADLANLSAVVTGPLAYSAIADTVGNLVVADTVSGFIVPGTDLTVTDAASLAQLAALDATNGDGALVYTTLTGMAADLAANAGGYVAAGIDVEVQDAATIAQLTAIDAANGDGALVYTAVADSLANLIAGGEVDPFIVAGTDVAATGVATVDDLAAIDAANGDGALTCTALTDTWQRILSEEAQGFLGDVGVVRLSSYALGPMTVAQVQALLALPNLQDVSAGSIELADLTFSLADTAGNLASSAAGVADIVTLATAVGATEAARVWQAEIIHARDAEAVYSIVDGSYALANGDMAAVTAAVDLTASNLAQAGEAATILARDGATGAVTFGIRDTFANVDAIGATVRNAAVDIAVTTQSYGWPFLTTAQASTAIGYGNAGRTDIAYIRGTAAEIGSFVAANEETTGPSGLGYAFWVQDSTTAMLAAIGDGSAGRLGFMRGNPATDLEGDHRAVFVEVSGHFNVASAETFRPAAESIYATDTNGRTYYGINDVVAAYDNESATGNAVTGADHLRVTDTAASVHAAQNGLDADHSEVFSLLAARASSADSIIVSGSAGNQSIRGTMGSDVIETGADHDVVRAGGGGDVIIGGSGADYLYGEGGRDVIHAGDFAANTVYADARFRGANLISGGDDGDNLFGSVDFDIFVYEGSSRAALRAESGTTSQARDYITNFHLGDRLQFTGIDADQVQFFGGGSANAQAVEAGIVALSIRYEKNIQVLNWEGDDIVTATRILVDVADANGRFDDVADMHTVLVGSNIDVNWDGYSILYGG